MKNGKYHRTKLKLKTDFSAICVNYYDVKECFAVQNEHRSFLSHRFAVQNSAGLTSLCSIGTKLFFSTRFLIFNIFCAAWMSLSSSYPHSHLYVLSSKDSSFNLWHFGHHFVVGMNLSNTMVYGNCFSFAFIIPMQLC